MFYASVRNTFDSPGNYGRTRDRTIFLVVYETAHEARGLFLRTIVGRILNRDQIYHDYVVESQSKRNV